MASPLTKRALQTIADTGFARAKKLADLSIKTNTDSSGSPTARGYEQALSYLQPFTESGKETEALDAQRLIAGYGNSLDKLSSKKRDQNETVAAFKLQELDSYFTTFDGDVGSFRNPSDLIDTTSESLDNLVLGVVNAIDEKQANGDSTDALYGYLNDLNKRADSMRDLRNKFQRGELTGQTLDGFGYYVDTNPIDGSIRSAALLPIGTAPDGLTSGYRRLQATTNVGGALLPVYAPSQKDAQGEYTSRVGDATWSGTGEGALQPRNAKQSKVLFSEGGFNISDSSSYPLRKNSVERGAFGRGFIGRDEQGNPVESVVYRGEDNKLYAVDQATVEKFKQDPLLSKKLDGYVTQFSPSEMKDLSKEAVPFSEDRVAFESRISGFNAEAQGFKAESDRIEGLGFFGKVKEGLSSMFGGGSESAPEAAPAPRASFFDKKNIPTTPERPTVSSSTPDIVEQGKSFFRSNPLTKPIVEGFAGKK